MVIHKAKLKWQDLRDPKVVNHALRSGAPVQTIEKSNTGHNNKSAPAVNARKLDEAVEMAALDRVLADVRHAIQKARLDKKMRQADLAKRINELP